MTCAHTACTSPRALLASGHSMRFEICRAVSGCCEGAERRSRVGKSRGRDISIVQTRAAAQTICALQAPLRASRTVSRGNRRRPTTEGTPPALAPTRGRARLGAKPMAHSFGGKGRQRRPTLALRAAVHLLGKRYIFLYSCGSSQWRPDEPR
jgi:hypothetical protein